MPSAQAPADPAETEPGLLPEAQTLVEAFCRHGASIIIGVIGLSGRPLAGVALGCTEFGPNKVRVLLSRPLNSELLHGLMRNSRIALTVSEVPTHRSIQIKGEGAVLLAAQAEDLHIAKRQLRAFRDQLIDAEYGEAFATAYCRFDPAEAVAVEFIPRAAFTQTPGPRAGERLQESVR